MVSAAKVCIFTVAFVALMATICVAPPPPGRGNWKCKASEEDKEEKEAVQGKCYEEATGKTLPPKGERPSRNPEDMPSRAEFEAIMLCVGTEMGVVKDGEFDAEQAKILTADRVEADDATKQAIRDAIDACDAEDGDVTSKLECSHKAVMTACKGK